jgi:hypothetical protein
MIYSAICQSLNVQGSERVAQLMLTDDEAIQLAHEMADGIGMTPIEVYQGICAGEAAVMGRKLLVHD